MKNFVSKSVILIMIVAFLGCSSDSSNDSNSCIPITCVNGGTSTTDCGCDCPDGYAGADCSYKLTPTKIFISKISVIQFPNKDKSNSSWDVLDPAPDVYIDINDSSKNVLFSSDVFYPNAVNDANKPLDFIFNIPFELPNVNKPYAIELWDDDLNDRISSDDEYMARVILLPYDSYGAFPKSVILENTSEQVKIQVDLIYQFE